MRIRELARFALGGLWRQKVRTALTLVGVTVGTCALAFSLALGIGLRQFIDNEFQGRRDFWRVHVHVAEPAVDKDKVPEKDRAKVTVQGQMSAERRARIEEALLEKYQSTVFRKPPVLLTPQKLAAIAALPDVEEVRATRQSSGRVWLGDRSAEGMVVAGRVADMTPRLIAGRLPDPAADEVLVSEFVLYELGVRDDAAVAGLVGRTVQLDAGGVQLSQTTALARALIGRNPGSTDLTRGQADALKKLTDELPHSLDKFDLTPQERAELRALLAKKADPDDLRPDSGRVASGTFRIAGVIRLP
ncbi:MAG: ABC transporter permease, partial [Gemmataceae bacterium]|nr:ABC transporter permease [Gemmataceae bacterium]